MSEIHTTFFNFSEVELLRQILPSSDKYEFTSKKVFRRRFTPTCTCGCKCVYNGYNFARKNKFGKVKIGKYICPATNNAIENYYSTSLKTHRKKQFRTDRGLENHMKIAALKRQGLLCNPKETLFEIYLKIYLVVT
ncbi:MAG: hypothetical protein U9Q69_05125 [Nanoarchaeota archaeon]|nr:hypothetical protein [Nanoarchaeota archaeon]